MSHPKGIPSDFPSFGDCDVFAVSTPTEAAHERPVPASQSGGKCRYFGERTTFTGVSFPASIKNEAVRGAWSGWLAVTS